uniref:Uncharacterized protein n=1 Tax=Arundo donax TaxID=35708 RepID=A0A0A9AVQ3_ARUDO
MDHAGYDKLNPTTLFIP